MFAKSVLVTGCARGVGLEWIKQLTNKAEHIFAGCRSPSTAKELNAIADVHANVIVLELDVTKEDSVNKAVARISEIVKDDGINCLINNAGVAHRINSFDKLTIDIIQHTHETNVVGPVRMIKACLPLLKQASSKCSNDHMSISRASIINVSSNFASLELTNTTENLCFAYRMSKAALNMLTRTLSVEYRSECILVISIHPGWVQTTMGGANAILTPTESVEGMLKVALSLNEHSGGLNYGWDGSIIPW